MLTSLVVLLDLANKGRWLKILPLTGMNPILAYAAITNLVLPLDGLLGFSDRLSATALADHPWAIAFLDGGVKTLLVALVAAAFTKARLFLRA
jgi:hypothetical protein